MGKPLEISRRSLRELLDENHHLSTQVTELQTRLGVYEETQRALKERIRQVEAECRDLRGL